jgi:hypothetical protein
MSSKRTFVITDNEKNEYRIIAHDIGTALVKVKKDHNVDEIAITHMDCNGQISTLSPS